MDKNGNTSRTLSLKSTEFKAPNTESSSLGGEVISIGDKNTMKVGINEPKNTEKSTSKLKNTQTS